MSECTLTPDIVRKINLKFLMAQRMLRGLAPSDIIREHLNKAMLEFSQYKSANGEDYKNEEVLEAIIQASKTYKISGGTLNDIFPLTDNEIIQRFNSIKNGGIQEATGNETTEQLSTVDSVKYEKDSKGEFLKSSYGMASRVRAKAEQEMRTNFVNSVLVDRRLGDYNHRNINNNVILNEKIRQFKELLFKDIIDTLIKYDPNTPGIDKLKTLTMFRKNSDGTYEYTGALEQLEQFSGIRMFKPESIQDSNYLINIDEDPNRKYILKGYNAYQFLNHFDEYFFMKYGKMILFEKFGQRTGQDVYKFAEKGTENITTWRDSDDTPLEKNCPLAVQELIETTHLYSFGSNNPKSSNGDLDYLKFSDLSLIIGKLKELVFNTSDIDFNYLESATDSLLIDKLDIDLDTKNTIKGLSLHKLINLIKLNPQKYLSAIFNILGNVNNYSILGGINKEFARYLSAEDKDIIWSLNKEIFGSEENTVRKISEGDITNYFTWITQVCDSIHRINFMQYYRGSDGIVVARNMTNTRLDKVDLAVRLGIRVLNSLKANMSFSDFVTNNKIIVNAPLDKNKEQGVLESFVKQFDDGTYLKFIIDNKGDKITIYEVEADLSDSSKFINDDEAILETTDHPAGLYEFISQIIGQNINDNFFRTAEYVSGIKLNKLLQDLLNLTARTLFLRHFSSEVLKGIYDDTSILNKAKLLLGSKIKYDKTLGEIDTIHDKDINTIAWITLTVAYQQGLFSSNQIKNGNGNAQSQYSLSRLLGTFPTLMEVLCKSPEAAVSHFSLLKTPGLMKGIFTAREFYSVDDTKDHCNFISSEFFLTLLVLDFLGGFAHSEKSVTGNGIISFIPSVNSDKNTVGRLLIDSNKTISYKGVFGGISYDILNKPIKNLSSQELDAIIANELGTSYYNTLNRILDDYRTLLQFADPELAELVNELLYIKDFESLNNAIRLKYNVNPVSWIKQKIKEYNALHRIKPLQFIDEIHFAGKKNLEANKTLISYLYRFEKGAFLDPNLRREFAYFDSLGGINSSFGYVNNDEFWSIKNTEIFRSLLKSGFTLDTTSFDQPGVSYLLKEYGKQIGMEPSEYRKLWVDNKTGYLILGYVDGIPIRTIDDLNGLDLTDSKVLLTEHNFEVNPLLEHYNKLDYLFTLEFMLSTVGSCIAHPAKGAGIHKILNKTKIYITGNSKTTASYALQINGIDTLRHPDVNGMHFGNPFSHNSQQGIVTGNGTVKDAVIAFDLWLKGTNYLDIEPLRRLWILNQINSGLLDNKTLVYYTDKVPDNSYGINAKYSEQTPSHANILAKYIDKSKKIRGVYEIIQYDVLEEEAARYQALHKRNVSFTASMQAFLLGTLNGIPSLYNIAIIDDIRDKQYNISGDVEGIKPYDGATFVNPFVCYLENNSLGGAKAGISKKQFVHYYDSRTGTGGIIKTAGFGLTNDWIRNSKMLLRMMHKMTKGTWLNEDGSEAFIDITLGYDGKPILYGDHYFKLNGKYYKIDANDIICQKDEFGNSTNNYKVLATELIVDRTQGQLGVNSYTLSNNKVALESSIDENGLPIISVALNENGSERTPLVHINSNYTLWNLFGGMNALELNNNSLVPSENSITKVVQAMNSIGTVKEGIQNVTTQDDIYQNLKHSDIHYCPTIGAVKQGASNINGTESYYDSNDYSFMKINLLLIGIQLDKEHHADGEELSLMTLVISACAHRGYTAEVADKIYQALHTLTEIGTKDLLDPVKAYFQVFSEDLKTRDEETIKAAELDIKEAVVNTVISALSSELDESSLLYSLASNLLAKARKGEHLKLREDIEGNLPIDNPAIYGLFLGKLSIFLTNSGIKAKIPGILSVLTPSHQLMMGTSATIEDSDGNPIQVFLKPEALLNHFDSITKEEINELLYLDELLSKTPTVIDENGVLNLHNLYQNRKYTIKYSLPLFTLGDFSDGRFAQTSNGLIIYRESPVGIEEFFDYIKGNTGGGTGIQKAEVFNRLLEKGWTEEKLRSLIKSEEDVLKVILWHEQAHKDNPPANYWLYEKNFGIIYNSKDLNYDESKINWLDENKIIEELRATEVALNKLQEEKKPVFIRTAYDRKKLVDKINKGEIAFCLEYIKDGRDLGEYDAQFTTTSGNKYSLWDLDSTQALFKLKDILDLKSMPLFNIGDVEYLGLKIKYSLNLENGLSIIAINGVIYVDPVLIKTNSLTGLPELSAENAIKCYALTEYVKNNLILLEGEDNNSFWSRCRNIALEIVNETKEGLNIYKAIELSKLKLNEGINALEDLETELRKRVRRDLAVLSKNGKKFYDADTVKINGQEFEIDRNSGINIIPYEIILPKTNATSFALNPYDSVADIICDKEFFFKRMLKNFEGRLPHQSSFDIELKRLNNDSSSYDSKKSHIYLLDKESIAKNGGRTKYLHKKEILKETIHNKLYRVDPTGKPIYELSSNEDEVWEDSNGTEVIITNNTKFYLEKLKYNVPKISEYYYLDGKNKQGSNTFNKFYQYIKEAGAKNKAAKSWIRYMYNSSIERNAEGKKLFTEDGKPIFKKGEFVKQEINKLLDGNLYLLFLQLQQTGNALILPLFKLLYRLGKEIHSSFIQSLECVASRTPSLSLQSFMPMKVVAFDNPNKNTAYVSTAQIWLLGSDYDIDAVSIAMYDIDDSGKIVLWSPHADLSSILNLKKSMEIPFPTGKTLQESGLIKEMSDRSANNRIKDILDKYVGIENKLFIVESDENDKYILKLNKDCLNIDNNLIDFINDINSSGIPNISDYVVNNLVKNHMIGKLFSPEGEELQIGFGTKEHVFDILSELTRIIDEHNTYLNNCTAAESSSASNNFALYGMYSVISDPLNLVLAQFSVDATTGDIKKIGDGKTDIPSPSAQEVKSRTDGSFANKVESILENQVGKIGISVCAVGMKGYFGMTSYANKAINNFKEDPKEALRMSKRLLINGSYNEGIIGLGVTIQGKTYYSLSNINPQQAIVKELYNKIISIIEPKVALENSQIIQMLKQANWNDNPIIAKNYINQLSELVKNTELKQKDKDYVDYTLERVKMMNDLREINTEEDLALVLSAFLSLATDNAKELLLSKLNAGISTIGMYLYGIMIGMPVKDVAKVLMSDIGLLITGLMNNNIFSGLKGCRTLNDVFNYIEIGPKELIQSFGEQEFALLEDKGIFKMLPLKSVTNCVFEQLETKLESIISDNLHGLEIIGALANSNLPLKTKLEIIDSIVYNNTDENGNERKIELNSLEIKWKVQKKLELFKLELKKYIKLVNLILQNPLLYSDLKQLAEGGAEVRILGQVLGLNKGLPTKNDEAIAKIHNIENIITNRLQSIVDEEYRRLMLDFRSGKSNKKPNKEKIELSVKSKLNIDETDISIGLFSFNDDYREKIIDTYDKVKHSFNIFDCVRVSELFMGYFSTLATAHTNKLATSPKYDFVYNLGVSIALKFGLFGKDALNCYKGLERYYDDLVKKQWMLDSNIKFTLPAGSTLFIRGKLTKASVDTTIYLGTPDGDATFKYFIENYVIPKMKKGNIGYNKFIKDLKPQIITKSISHVPFINYSLPINMMPHTDAELALFDGYKAEFNKLSNKRASEFLPPNCASPGMTVLGLLYLYGLIAHYGRNGLQSLMRIFSNIQDRDLCKQFHTYESNILKKDIRIMEDKYDELYPYILPTLSLYSARANFVYALDKSDMIIKLYKKTNRDPVLEIGGQIVYDNSIINGYEPMYNESLARSLSGNNYLYGNLAKTSNSYENYRVQVTENGTSASIIYDIDDKGNPNPTLNITYNKLVEGESYSIPVSLNNLELKEMGKLYPEFNVYLSRILNGESRLDYEYYNTLLKQLISEITNNCD